jgi:uncharacterized protein YkwD
MEGGLVRGWGRNSGTGSGRCHAAFVRSPSGAGEGAAARADTTTDGDPRSPALVPVLTRRMRRQLRRRRRVAATAVSIVVVVLAVTAAAALAVDPDHQTDRIAARAGVASPQPRPVTDSSPIAGFGSSPATAPAPAPDPSMAVPATTAVAPSMASVDHIAPTAGPADDPPPLAAPAEPEPVAASTTAPTPSGSARPTDPFDAAIFDLMNRDRANAGLRGLVGDPRLDSLARSWSAQMAADDELHHQDLTALWNTSDWATYSLGENIYAVPGDWTPEQVEAGWMASPPHRANILSATFTLVGIGHVLGSDGRIWVTADFAAPA